MSEKIYDVSAEWSKRAFVDDAKYREMYARSVSDPNGFWAEQAKRVDWIKAPPQDRERLLRARQHLDQMVRGRRPQRRLELHRPPSRKARRPDRDHLGGRRSLAVQAHHLPRAARRSLPDGQHPAHPERQEGRPRHHLPADDSRKPPTRCWPARGSAPSIRWCSPASRRTASPSASPTASPRSSSPPTKACAAARRCR